MTQPNNAPKDLNEDLPEQELSIDELDQVAGGALKPGKSKTATPSGARRNS